ncbi:MAG: hypothetical protein ACR2KI_06875 [Candidatus Limnocylindria bacterium]
MVVGLVLIVITGSLGAGVLAGLFSPTRQAGSGFSGACPVTRPDPPFIAPSPNPASPPSASNQLWYGSAALWTALGRNGEVWKLSDFPVDTGGISQKIFWGSAYSPGSGREADPAITVDGTRLDGQGSFRSGPFGANTGNAEWGDMMLVDIAIPSAGCWRITGHYRGAALSYVVWIKADRAASPSGSPPRQVGSAGPCPVTRPIPPFTAPSPNPASPPSASNQLWYGSAALWTVLDRNGEIWDLSQGSGGQKTFWDSVNWLGSGRESEPAITVEGTRLDGGGTFSSGPRGTNAGNAEYGDMMLTGITIPSAGCWRITGHYRGAELSYVVWVKGDWPAPASSSPGG